MKYFVEFPDKMLFDHTFYMIDEDKDGPIYQHDAHEISNIRNGYRVTIFPWDSAIETCDSPYNRNLERYESTCRSYKFKMSRLCDMVICLECYNLKNIIDTLWILNDK